MGVVCQFLAKFSSCVLLEVSIIVKEFLQYFTEIWGGSDRNNEMKFGQKKTKLWDRATTGGSVRNLPDYCRYYVLYVCPMDCGVGPQVRSTRFVIR